MVYMPSPVSKDNPPLRPIGSGEVLNVYKVSRSSSLNIIKQKLNLPFSYGLPNLLFEPFLIRYESDHEWGALGTWTIHNLLEPNAHPLSLKRSDYRNWIIRDHNYESDIRIDGKLTTSLLFPVVYDQNPTKFCVECFEISSASVRSLWTQTFDFNDSLLGADRDILFIDRDNYLVFSDFITEDFSITECYIYHVILSKAKITKYEVACMDDSGSKDSDRSFAVFEETLFMNIRTEHAHVFGSFSSPGNSFNPICFIVKHKYEDLVLRRDEILYFPENKSAGIKRIKVSELMDYINDKNQKKTCATTGIFSKQVTAPYIDLGKTIREKKIIFICILARLDFPQIHYEIEQDRSKTARVLGRKIEIFI